LIIQHLEVKIYVV